MASSRGGLPLTPGLPDMPTVLRFAGVFVLVALACGRPSQEGQKAPAPSAPAEAAPAPAPEPLSGAAKKGKPLYQQKCAGCHGEDGSGRTAIAAQLDPKPRDLTSGVFKLGTTRAGSLPSDADLARTITQGISWSSMHVAGSPSADDVGAIVEYVEHFARHRDATTGAFVDPFAAARPALDVPAPPDSTPALVAHGRALFSTTCASCHGESGRGDGPLTATLVDQWGDKLAPRDLTVPVYKAGASARDVFVTVTRGIPGTPMPPMAPLPPNDRWAISHYVVSLQQLPTDVAKRGEVLFRAHGCVDCHGKPNAGGIVNPNAVKERTPDLGTLSERLFLYEPEDIDTFVSLLEKHDTLDDVKPPDVPRWPAVLAQYRSVRQVIAAGAQSAQKDPKGEAPAMSMPSWEHRLSARDVNAIVAYLVLLGKDDDDE